jgi:thiamine biosynthesis protein ThiS
VKLVINGKEREAPALATVADLARWMELPAHGTAVELNGAVIPRRLHGEHPLRDGDRLEVVRLVGGG